MGSFARMAVTLYVWPPLDSAFSFARFLVSPLLLRARSSPEANGSQRSLPHDGSVVPTDAPLNARLPVHCLAAGEPCHTGNACPKSFCCVLNFGHPTAADQMPAIPCFPSRGTNIGELLSVRRCNMADSDGKSIQSRICVRI